MTQQGHSRRMPSVATLGLTRSTAAEDLEFLGWDSAESTELLWCLAAAGDPDLALNNLVRLYTALDGEAAALDRAVRDEEALRVRLIALLGASTALGDHLVAHPEQWRELGKALPEPAEMNRALLESIEARPADYAAPLEHPDSASDTLDTPGTYRAESGCSSGAA